MRLRTVSISVDLSACRKVKEVMIQALWSSSIEANSLNMRSSDCL